MELKSKVFSITGVHVGDALEKEVNEWLKKNPDITIVQMQQSVDFGEKPIEEADGRRYIPDRVLLTILYQS